RVGIDFLVEKHWPEIEAEYALAEGGSAIERGGKVRYVTVGTTEKVPRAMRLVARGTAGHGSRPTPDNAIVRLATAVAKIGAWQPPMRLNDTTRAYFERLATISPPEEARRYTRIVDPAQSPAIERHFAQHEYGHYSMLRTSVVPTILKGGFRTNVIPSEAEATLDIRALPDEDLEKLQAEMRKVIDDSSVEIVGPVRRGRPVARPSRHDTEMFRAIEKTTREMFPGAIALPMMLVGATDMAQLRAKGVEAYGYGPVVPESNRHGAHSDDERIPEGSLEKLVEFLWRAATQVAAAK
ncbi:MAG: M20/M25/M40 family metallo-hydrolase, partial [Bryobacteraceae bacterium]